MKKKLTILIMTVLLCMALVGGSAGVLAFAESNNNFQSGAGESFDEEIDTSAETHIQTVNYNGSFVNYTLTPGRYKFVLYGALGGQGTSNTNNYSQGGNGAIVTTYYNTNSSTTLTFSGGKYPGASTTGGYWYFSGNRSAGNGAAGRNGNHGGGGGGATTISSGSTLIAIAGGGGGGSGGSQGGGSSQSRGNQGGASSASGSAGSGGSGYSGGAGGGASQGGGGRGGAAGMYSYSGSRDRTYYPPGGGGGGAGYYGGGGGGGSSVSGRSGANAYAGGSGSYLSAGSGGSPCSSYYAYFSGYAGSGGGGSSWVNTSYCDSTSYTSGNGGNGYVLIYRINSSPTSREATLSPTSGSGFVRGNNSQIFNISTIAADSDIGDAVKFVDTNALYEDAGLTNSASEFVSFYAGVNTTTFYFRTQRTFAADKWFYVRVKDNQNAITTVRFKIKTYDNPLTNNNNADQVLQSGGAVIAKIGKASTNDPKQATTATGRIYNKNWTASNAPYTLFIYAPVTPGKPVTVNASSFFADADTSYDSVVFKPINVSSSYFTISNNSLTDGGYASFTVAAKGSATNPNYEHITVEAYSAEKSTDSLIGNTISFTLVFKVDNTRPYFLSVTDCLGATATGPEAVLSVGVTKTLNLSQICKDPDNSTLVINEVKIPSNEYLPLNKYGQRLTFVNGSAYNISGNQIVGEIGDNSYKDPSKNNSMTSAEGSISTGFEKSWLAATGSAAAPSAFVSYSISGANITLRGEHATKYSYVNSRSINGQGHFYVMVRITDSGEAEDKGIWYPIAVTVANSQPSNLSTAPKAEGNVGDSFVFSPMGVGRYKLSSGLLSASDAPALAADLDMFTTGNLYNTFLFLNGNLSTGDVSISDYAANSQYFTVTKKVMYVPEERMTLFTAAERALGGFAAGADTEIISEGGTQKSFYKFYGIEVTLKRFTQNKFIEFSIGIKDTQGAANSINTAIKAVVKVNNRYAVIKDTANDLGGMMTWTPGCVDNPLTGENEYVPSTARYYIKNNQNVKISPYDFVIDNDMNTYNETQFSLNTGYNSQYTSFINKMNAKNSVIVRDSRDGTATRTNLGYDQLHVNQGFNVMGSEASVAYVPQSGNTVAHLNVTTVQRTLPTAPVKISMYVNDLTDAAGNAVLVNIEIHVINSLPELQNSGAGKGSNQIVNTTFEMYTDIRGTSSDSVGAPNVNYNVRYFKASDILYDYDGSDNANLIFKTSVAPETYIKNGSNMVRYADGNKNLRIVYENGIMKVTALSGTVMDATTGVNPIPGGILYVKFTANDGRDDGDAELFIQIKVNNSKPYMNAGASDYSFDATGTGASSTYSWVVTPDNNGDLKSVRYVVSSKVLADALVAKGIPASRIKVLALDSDKEQGLLLHALDITAVPGVSMGFNTGDNATAINYTNPYSDEINKLGVSVQYYDPVFNEVNYAGGTVWNYNFNWAIKISAPSSFSSAAQFQVKTRDTHYQRVGNSAPQETFAFTYTLNGLGLVNNHTAYASIGNNYAVADDEGNLIKVENSIIYGDVVIGSAANAEQFVPLSYFALPVNLTENKTEHVSFASTKKYTEFSNSDIRVSDGKNTWNALENPYVSIGATGYGGNFATETNPYFNKKLSSLNADKISTTVISTSIQQGFSENKNGLNFRKKGSRTPVGGITVSIDFISSNGSGTATGNANVQTVTVKLMIDNSPIRLGDIGNNIKYDSVKKQASVDVNMTVGSPDLTIALVNGSYDSSNNFVVSPEDKVLYDGNKNVQYIQYMDGDNGANAEYKDIAKFNVSSISGLTDEDVSGITNRYGYLDDTAGKSSLGTVNNYFKQDITNNSIGYTPNRASVNNYTDYFKILENEDGRFITVHPLNKTFVNSFIATDPGKTMSELLAERGLVSKNGKIYYPLQVMVYDDYMDGGFGTSSYMVLTLNICIGNTNPEISSSVGNLPNDTATYKEYEIALATGNDYTVNLSEVVYDNDIYKIDGKFATLAQLKASSDPMIRETKDWFKPVNSATLPAGEGNIEYGGVKAVDITTSSGGLELNFKVNSRIFTADSDNKVMFAFTFDDSQNGKTTKALHFIINIINKAPEIRTTANENTVIKMRAGDTFTLLTTPYEKFNSMNTEGNLYNIKTYEYYKTALDAKPEWDYSKVNTTAFDNDSSDINTPSYHLGYLPLADDDTPWSLRIKGISYNNQNSLTYTLNNKLAYEKDAATVGSLSVTFRAERACNNELVNITLSDGDTVITVTFSITVVSSVPQYIKSERDAPVGWAEKGITFAKDLNGNTIEGIYDITVRYGETKNLYLRDFAYDIDNNETNKMFIYDGYNGKPFSINGDLSGLSETAYLKLNKKTFSNSETHLGYDLNGIVINCKNFINSTAAGSYETVKFYINDAGSLSFPDSAIEITLRIRTVYSDVYSASSNILESDTGTDFNIGSKANFDEDGYTTDLKLMLSDNTGTVKYGKIIDSDYNLTDRNNSTKYALNVYALVKYDSVKNTYTNLLTSEFKNMYVDRMVRVGDKNYIARTLKDSWTEAGAVKRKEDLCIMTLTDSGIVLHPNGISGTDGRPGLTDTNMDILYSYATKYFDININDRGTVLSFTPKTSTLKMRIPLFLEMTKVVDADLTDDKTSLSAGYKFNLAVTNSAPTAVENDDTNKKLYEGDYINFLDFKGKVGDRAVYKIQDLANPTKSLFGDIDLGDVITVAPVTDYNRIVPSTYTLTDEHGSETQYETSNLWKYDPVLGMQRAFDIRVDKSNGTVTFEIKRRIDNPDNPGEPVIIPVNITGTDSSGASVTTQILMQIFDTAPKYQNLKVSAGDGPTYSVTETNDQNGKNIFKLEMSVEMGINGKIKLNEFVYDLDVATDKLSDSYQFVSLSDRPLDNYFVGSAYTAKDKDSKAQFKITSNTANTELTVEALSHDRAATATFYMVVGDRAYVEGNNYHTIEMEVVLTVANSKPALVDISRNINVLGGETGPSNGVFESVVYDLKTFVKDPNPGDNTYSAGANSTHLSIREVSLLDSNGIFTTIKDEDGKGSPDSLFTCGMVEGDATKQKFFIRIIPKVYGNQKFKVVVIDDGGTNNGSAEDELTVEFSVSVAKDPTSQKLNAQAIPWMQSRLVDVKALLYDAEFDINYGIGYSIKAMSSEFRDSVEIQSYKDDTGKDILDEYGRKQYTVKPIIKEGSAKVFVTFIVGEKEYQLEFVINVLKNNAPTLIKEEILFVKDVNRDENGIAEVTVDTLLSDPDSDLKNVVLLSASSQKSVVVTASIDKARNVLILTFKGRGDSKITLQVTDETGESYTRSFTAKNLDMDPLNFFSSIIANVQGNPLIWICVAAGVALLIVILIIIIAVSNKKKRTRLELEAMLVSEMELEEQMMKLAASPTPTYYQSYGYLPPTQNINQDPGLMLGSGAPAPNPGQIQLNSGNNNSNTTDGMDPDDF